MEYIFTYYNKCTGLKWSVDIIFCDYLNLEFFKLFIDKVMYEMDYIVLTLFEKE